jgi:hypothetical protein
MWTPHLVSYILISVECRQNTLKIRTEECLSTETAGQAVHGHAEASNNSNQKRATSRGVVEGTIMLHELSLVR